MITTGMVRRARGRIGRVMGWMLVGAGVVACGWAGEAERASVRREVGRAAARYGVSPRVAAAIAHVESGFNARARSPKGAIGVMQLMPQTAALLGVNVYSTWENIDGGVRYFRWLVERYHGNMRLAVAAYNAGPGAVDRYRGVPPYIETQNYVGAVAGAAAGRAEGPRRRAVRRAPMRSVAACYPSEIAFDGRGQAYIRARRLPAGCEPVQ